MPKKKKKTPPNRDPRHMAEIGAKGGTRTKKKHGAAYYSELAKKSHPRKEYKGGRRPKPNA